ncbi:glycerol-3-phosphate 1-O-acyltransferase PlsY [candidate division GN15 bacterium]|nr:glycerol-3-phosphate 1-O-acyltransferase PlsY [candidate division GN15 bacterium]
MLKTLTPILGAYLVGAIPFALIVARLYGIPDIRKIGSGNVGATNVQRAAGFGAALWVYLFDIGKGAAAVLVARQIDQTLLQRDLFLVLVALAVVLGHIFPVYLAFRGGKGVNTVLGAVGSLFPIEALICFGVFAVVVLLTRYISLGSICGAVAFPVVMLIERFALGYAISNTYLITAVVIGLLVPLTHVQNIKRLTAGSESRVRFTRKTSSKSQQGTGSHV